MQFRHRIGRFWNKKYRFHNRHRHPINKGENIILNQLPEGESAIIVNNQNLKTIERGLYPGAQIFMLRNRHYEPNLVIAVGDARYVLDRRISKQITVIIQ
ncbi:MAG TPA: FeoA family protein [Candidatus Syntrophosphaera sp.]|jgi:Fe2+ transport system protein FeoA|nr:FeoA family protein [Candidatus Syntrophosphaera sp.]HQM79116.1 FeoA family protein [Candidatus Syntrophosphaera sp.]